MNDLKIKRRWEIIYSAIFVLVVSCFYLIWVLNNDVIIDIFSGRRVEVNALLYSAIYIVVLLLIFGGMIYIVLSDALTTFTKEGINRPGISQRHIRWDSITRIDNLTYQLVFFGSSNTSIGVNLLLIKDVKGFLLEINQRIPPHLRR